MEFSDASKIGSAVETPPDQSGISSRNASTECRPGTIKKPAPCKFFRQGRCTKGDACTFSHELEEGAQSYQGTGPPLHLPPPVIINIPPGSASIFSIDVECVATGFKSIAKSF